MISMLVTNRARDQLTVRIVLKAPNSELTQFGLK